eukprot:c12658_g1_i2 orf=65-319(+)
MVSMLLINNANSTLNTVPSMLQIISELQKELQGEKTLASRDSPLTLYVDREPSRRSIAPSRPRALSYFTGFACSSAFMATSSSS